MDDGAPRRPEVWRPGVDGMDDEEQPFLLVDALSSGALERHGKEHPADAVIVGDKIVAVDGEAGVGMDLWDGLLECKEREVVVPRELARQSRRVRAGHLPRRRERLDAARADDKLVHQPGSAERAQGLSHVLAPRLGGESRT